MNRRQPEQRARRRISETTVYNSIATVDGKGFAPSDRAPFDSFKMNSSLWRARRGRGMDDRHFSAWACCCTKKPRSYGEAVAVSESLAKTQKRVRAALGHKVRELRRSLDLTQADLAGKAGIRRGSVIEVERGEANPTLDTIVGIAAALRVEPSELLVLDR